MEACTKCTKKGTEKNPLGLGICAKHHDVGLEHPGKDGNIYVVREDKIGRRTWREKTKKRTSEEIDRPIEPENKETLDNTQNDDEPEAKRNNTAGTDVIDPSQDIVEQKN